MALNLDTTNDNQNDGKPINDDKKINVVNAKPNDVPLQNTKPKLRMIDLFAGTGAFSYAFEQTGKVECVFANDIKPEAKLIYDLNHKTKLTLGDLNDIKNEDIPVHDIASFGFPCQPFSIAGEKKGFNDPRANIFWKIVDILKHHKTPIIILENVKNLTSHDNGNTFQTICNSLTGLGYHLVYNILNTCKITHIPQNRERIYMLGFLDGELADKIDLDFPLSDNSHIQTLLEDYITPTHPVNPLANQTQNIQPVPVQSELIKPLIKQIAINKLIPVTIPNKYYYTDKLQVYDEVVKTVTKPISEGVVYQYRRYYVRENMKGVCPTLTANMGSGGHNVPLIKDNHGIRKLTPRECFNLQGFPKNYNLPDISDNALYHLAGNAVSLPILYLICAKILRLFAPSSFA